MLGFATIALGPVGRLIPVLASLRTWRRELGVAFAATAVIHVAVFGDKVYDWDLLRFFEVADARRVGISEAYVPANWIGAVALVLLVLLSAVSNEPARRRLGATWNVIQRHAYVAWALSLLHAWIFVSIVGPRSKGSDLVRWALVLTAVIWATEILRIASATVKQAFPASEVADGKTQASKSSDQLDP